MSEDDDLLGLMQKVRAQRASVAQQLAARDDRVKRAAQMMLDASGF